IVALFLETRRDGTATEPFRASWFQLSVREAWGCVRFLARRRRRRSRPSHRPSAAPRWSSAPARSRRSSSCRCGLRQQSRARRAATRCSCTCRRAGRRPARALSSGFPSPGASAPRYRPPRSRRRRWRAPGKHRFDLKIYFSIVLKQGFARMIQCEFFVKIRAEKKIYFTPPARPDEGVPHAPCRPRRSRPAPVEAVQAQPAGCLPARDAVRRAAVSASACPGAAQLRDALDGGRAADARPDGIDRRPGRNHHAACLRDALHLRRQVERGADAGRDDAEDLCATTCRRGGMLHSGRELPADDVGASLQRWMDQSPRGKAMGKEIETLEAEGPLGVKIVLKAPYASLLSQLALQSGMAAIMAKDSIASPLKDFVGTGPYKFKERRPDQFVLLTRFDKYAARKEPASGYGGKREAAIEELRFVPVPNAGTRVEGALAGQYDFADLLPVEALPRLEKSGGKTVPIMT